MQTDFLERELVMPPGTILIPGDDQRAGLATSLTMIGEHFAKPNPPPPKPGDPVHKPLTLALAGWAGTGKTTVMRILIRYLIWNKIHVNLLAPTGKAADRLRQVLRQDYLYKQDPIYTDVVDHITTIHKYLYGAPVSEAQCPECKKWDASLVEPPDRQDHRLCPNLDCSAQIPLQTDLRTRLTWAPPPRATSGARNVIIVDEGSMVARNVHNDLQSAIPSTSVLYYVWDKGQLPPVVTEEDAQTLGIDPKDPWGPTAPDVVPVRELREVHRQAAGSPILVLATAIREGRLIDPPMGTRPAIQADQRLTLAKYVSIETPVDWLVNHRRANRDATLICYTNRTRQTVNALVRDRLGLVAESQRLNIPVVPRDLMLCRVNNANLGLMNGTLFTVRDVKLQNVAVYRRIDSRGKLVDRDDVPMLEIFTDDGILWAHPRAIGATHIIHRDLMRDITRTARLVIDYIRQKTGETPAPWEVEEYLQDYDALSPEVTVHLDYGQCITGHASQGSQWDSVGGIWEGACWAMWHKERDTAIRWLYTLCTRAAQNLALFTIRKEH